MIKTLHGCNPQKSTVEPDQDVTGSYEKNCRDFG